MRWPWAYPEALALSDLEKLADRIPCNSAGGTDPRDPQGIVTQKIRERSRSARTELIRRRDVRNHKTAVRVDANGLPVDGDDPGIVQLSSDRYRTDQHTQRYQCQ